VSDTSIKLVIDRIKHCTKCPYWKKFATWTTPLADDCSECELRISELKRQGMWLEGGEPE
jgi:hypothetical protein